ncbi:MAG: hypothetical protein ACLGH2_13905, partial [Gammaproteobacteria bacterium]
GGDIGVQCAERFAGAMRAGGDRTGDRLLVDVRHVLQRLADATQADEFMIVSDVFDPALRLRSLDIAAEAMREPVPA